MEAHNLKTKNPLPENGNVQASSQDIGYLNTGKGSVETGHQGSASFREESQLDNTGASHQITSPKPLNSEKIPENINALSGMNERPVNGESLQRNDKDSLNLIPGTNERTHLDDIPQTDGIQNEKPEKPRPALNEMELTLESNPDFSSGIEGNDAPHPGPISSKSFPDRLRQNSRKPQRPKIVGTYRPNASSRNDKSARREEVGKEPDVSVDEPQLGFTPVDEPKNTENVKTMDVALESGRLDTDPQEERNNFRGSSAEINSDIAELDTLPDPPENNGEIPENLYSDTRGSEAPPEIEAYSRISANQEAGTATHQGKLASSRHQNYQVHGKFGKDHKLHNAERFSKFGDESRLNIPGTRHLNRNKGEQESGSEMEQKTSESFQDLQIDELPERAQIENLQKSLAEKMDTDELNINEDQTEPPQAPHVPIMHMSRKEPEKPINGLYKEYLETYREMYSQLGSTENFEEEEETEDRVSRNQKLQNQPRVRYRPQSQIRRPNPLRYDPVTKRRQKIERPFDAHQNRNFPIKSLNRGIQIDSAAGEGYQTKGPKSPHRNVLISTKGYEPQERTHGYNEELLNVENKMDVQSEDDFREETKENGASNSYRPEETLRKNMRMFGNDQGKHRDKIEFLEKHREMYNQIGPLDDIQGERNEDEGAPNNYKYENQPRPQYRPKPQLPRPNHHRDPQMERPQMNQVINRHQNKNPSHEKMNEDILDEYRTDAPQAPTGHKHMSRKEPRKKIHGHHEEFLEAYTDSRFNQLATVDDFLEERTEAGISGPQHSSENVSGNEYLERMENPGIPQSSVGGHEYDSFIPGHQIL
ncbi:unnamed protein product, partial [Notodromas monacha]